MEDTGNLGKEELWERTEVCVGATRKMGGRELRERQGIVGEESIIRETKEYETDRTVGKNGNSGENEELWERKGIWGEMEL